MVLVKVHCSDCPEETELVVDDLDAADREVCACGYSFVVVSVADFVPAYAEPGELIRLRRPARLDQAA